MHCATIKDIDDSRLLVLASQNHSDNEIWQEVLARFQQPLFRFCRKKAPYFSLDFIDDVVQSTWVDFLRLGSGFDPRKCTPIQYLFGIASNSIRKTCTEYGFKFPRSLMPNPGTNQDHKKVESRDSIISTEALDFFPSEVGIPESAIQPLHVRTIIDAMPKHIGQAVEKIVIEDIPFGEAASRVKINRITLKRSLLKWGEEHYAIIYGKN